MGGLFPPTYLNIVFNGSTSALGAFRVGSSPAIQTREVVKLFHHYFRKSNTLNIEVLMG